MPASLHTLPSPTAMPRAGFLQLSTIMGMRREHSHPSAELFGKNIKKPNNE